MLLLLLLLRADPLDVGVEGIVRVGGVEASRGLPTEDRVGQAVLVGRHALLHAPRLRNDGGYRFSPVSPDNSIL